MSLSILQMATLGGFLAVGTIIADILFSHARTESDTSRIARTGDVQRTRRFDTGEQSKLGSRRHRSLQRGKGRSRRTRRSPAF